MTKGGALKSVLVVGTNDLEPNGGRYTLQQGPATKVRGFRSDNLGSRLVKGGDTLPVYVLTEADIRANGGRWRVNAGQAKQVSDVIGDTRGIIQGTAIPVFPVDDNGNFDPTWGSYAAKVLATQPSNLIGYWPMWESGGAQAVDYSSQDNHGAYTAVTLGQTGIGDGRTCPLFDGATSYMQFHSAGFSADFNGDEGTVLLWFAPLNIGVWTDATNRYFIEIFIDGNNEVRMWRPNDNNRIRWSYEAGGVAKDVWISTMNDVNLHAMALTWSISSGGTGEMKAYLDGIQQGATQVNLGAWAGGPLNALYQTVGAYRATPLSVWNGRIAHAAVWTVPLTQPEIANISTV